MTHHKYLLGENLNEFLDDVFGLVLKLIILQTLDSILCEIIWLLFPKPSHPIELVPGYLLLIFEFVDVDELGNVVVDVVSAL